MKLFNNFRYIGPLMPFLNNTEEEIKVNPLVIDLRQSLPWHKRYVSNTSTAMMWTLWILLWRPFVLLTVLLALHQGRTVHHLCRIIGVSIEHGLLAILFCAGLLLLQKSFSRPEKIKRLSLQSNRVEHTAQASLAISVADLYRTKIATVIHDEKGRIVEICRDRAHETTESMIPQ